MSQFTIPTLVTCIRLLAVPLVILGLSMSWLWSAWWTLSFFLAAAWTDWLDGYLARRLDQETEFGRFLDPLVDKFLVLGPMIALVYPSQALSARFIIGETISKMDAVCIIGVFIGVGLIASAGVGL